MITSWTSCTIQDLQNKGEAELKTGPFGTQLHASDYVETGTPVINVRNIGFGEIREEKLEFIAEETVQRLSSHLLEPGDIVFGRKGAVERHAFINPKYTRWFQGSDCLRLRVKSPSVDSRFLSYYFLTEHHKQWMINQCSHGATMASLNQAIISRIPLLLPSIHTQRKIISILSAYDDLIENNTRRIEILEEMARSLFREWFVNFRFPGHEQVKMVDSELGLIPEGWEVASFTDIADILSGGTPKTKIPEYWDGDIPFFTPKDAPSSFYVTETDKSITELGLKKCNSKLYPKNTVFITARGTVGKAVLTAVDMAMNQSCFAFKGREDINQYFIFLAINNYDPNLRRTASGATFDAIVIDNFRRLMVVKPPLTIVEKFGTVIEPFFEKILNLLKKIDNLRLTRDLLLPRLISGEIDVENLDINTG